MGKNARVEEEKKAPGTKRMTAYFLFQKEQRAKVVEENPGLKITEVAKLLGQKWRDLSTEEKTDYSERCKAMQLAKQNMNKRGSFLTQGFGSEELHFPQIRSASNSPYMIDLRRDPAEGRAARATYSMDTTNRTPPSQRTVQPIKRNAISTERKSRSFQIEELIEIKKSLAKNKVPLETKTLANGLLVPQELPDDIFDPVALPKIGHRLFNNPFLKFGKTRLKKGKKGKKQTRRRAL